MKKLFDEDDPMIDENIFEDLKKAIIELDDEKAVKGAKRTWWPRGSILWRGSRRVSHRA